MAFEEYTTRGGNGLFYVKIDRNYFNGHKNIQTKITPKGVEFFKYELQGGAYYDCLFD